jgi:cation:H+ antiporter
LVIVLAGVPLARYGDVLGEKTGLGRSWIGVVLVAATTSLPELFTGFGATALAALPDIAVGDVVGSCMFNLLILSVMDAIPRAHQRSCSPGSCAVHRIRAAPDRYRRFWTGCWHTHAGARLGGPALARADRPVFRRDACDLQARTAPAREGGAGGRGKLEYAEVTVRAAVLRYTGAAVVVVGAALLLPGLGAELARQTGLGGGIRRQPLHRRHDLAAGDHRLLASVRIAVIDLAIGNVLGSNLFNLLILGLDDVFYRPGPLLAGADVSHSVAILAVVIMNALFLIGLTYRVMTKRFVVTWDTGAMAASMPWRSSLRTCFEEST